MNKQILLNNEILLRLAKPQTKTTAEKFGSKQAKNAKPNTFDHGLGYWPAMGFNFWRRLEKIYLHILAVLPHSSTCFTLSLDSFP